MAGGGVVEVDVGKLIAVGKRLSHPSSSKDALLKVLKQASMLFGEIDQSPHHTVLSAMKPSMDALVQPGLLKHKDNDIRLLVAMCISEIMRIVAPDAPFSDEILKDIFELIVASFKGLNETQSPYFDTRVKILELVATVRSCVVMLDLECDDLIREMFQTFFSTVSEEPENVIAAMIKIMCLVLKESEEIPQQLLEVLLSNLLSRRKGVSKAGYILAGSVLERCTDELRPHVVAFLTSTMSEGKSSKSRWRESYNDLIYEIYTCAPKLLIPLIPKPTDDVITHDIYTCAPKLLIPLIPKLTDDLLTDKLDARLRAVNSLGRLFTSQKGSLPDGFNQLFTEYVKRFTDKAVEVRLAVVEGAKQCLLASPSGPEAEEFLAALSDRLQDYDYGVRSHVVVAICDYAKSNPELIPVDVLKRVAERLRDTEVFVRRETLQRLTELYRTFCLKKIAGSTLEMESFYWIPSKLIRCCFDRDCKEFRAQAMELVFSEQLFPSGFPVKERVKCWISFFGAFDNNDVKALERILLQKQRLHHEMKNYLALQQKLKDEESQENERKLQASCKSMASSFVEPANAELQLQKLSQLNDTKLLKDLAEFLDPNTSLSQTLSLREDLLKRLGEKHPQHEFLKVLAIKCSHVLFGKEHMQALLAEIDEFRRLGDEKMLEASMGLLVVFASHFPSLLEGAEGGVMELLKEDREFLKEGAVQILAKIGGSMRGQLTDESNSVDLLEKLCVEGSRKQAKYAVQALAAMSSDSGLKVFSALYRKLLDLLESGVNLPTVLQSLGCIAQHAISVFETREEDLVNFLVRDLFRRDSAPLDGEDTEHHDASETTRLKIFGLKTLVRSFLPNKDPQQAQRFKGLFGILLKFLECGEVSDEIKSSGFDKAHLRLAAATGVLRLSKRYDAQISPQLFHATVLRARDPSVFVKHQFLSKVHKFLKERAVPHKYACTLALSIGGDANDFLTEAKQQLGDFVDSSRRQARLREVSASGQLDAPLITYYPEYVLFYLVHTLAQEAEFPSLSEGGPSLEAIEPVFKQLSLFIWALLYHDGDGVRYDASKKEEPDKIASILGIFRRMKTAEDTVDASKTENTYILCDIGIAITKDLPGVELSRLKDADNIPLPLSIYKTLEDMGEGNQKVDGTHLPAFFGEGDTFSRMKSALPFSMDMVVKHGKRKADNGSLEEENKPRQKRSKVIEFSGGDEEQDARMSPKPPAASERRQGSGRKRSQNERTRPVENENLEGLDLTNPASPKRKRGGRSYKENGEVSSPDTKQGRTDETLSSLMRTRGRPKALNDVDEGVNDEVNLDILPTSEMASPDMESTAPGADGSARRRVRISIKKPRPPQEPMDESLKEEDSAGIKKRRGKKAMDGLQDDPTDNAEAQALKSPRGTPRRSAKKISISGLESPDSKVDKKGEASVDELVGSRISVWWPIDKKFYQGVVASYQASRKKYRVVYDDGDVEFLKLENERWEFLENEMVYLGSPSTSAPLEHGLQAKKKEVKSQTKRSSKRGSASRRSPRSRKQSKRETEPSDPSNVSDDTETLDQGHEVVDGEQTPATVSKGQSKSQRRSKKKVSAPPRAKGLKSSDLKSDDNTPEGSPSPTTSKDSKDSDDVPLDAWKLARRKAH